MSVPWVANHSRDWDGGIRCWGPEPVVRSKWENHCSTMAMGISLNSPRFLPFLIWPSGEDCKSQLMFGKFCYSSTNFMLLGMALAQATGAPCFDSGGCGHLASWAIDLILDANHWRWSPPTFQPSNQPKFISIDYRRLNSESNRFVWTWHDWWRLKRTPGVPWLSPGGELVGFQSDSAAAGVSAGEDPLRQLRVSQGDGWRGRMSTAHPDDIMAGWWFGTWILRLSIYWECHHPNWLIFSRGVETTNQMVTDG